MCLDNEKRIASLQWALAAPFYRFSNMRISHQVDEDLFAYLGDRLQGAYSADCGCGPGIVTAKLVEAGAARVYAVDGNRAMLTQVGRRLPDPIARGKVELVEEDFSPELFRRLDSRLPHGNGLDLVLFKRSLYKDPEQARKILASAGEMLSPSGAVVMIHPERSLRAYAFAPGPNLATYTVYHLFNRLISRLADWLGVGHYTLYSRSELFELFQSALPDLEVEWIPSRQTAFNLIAAREPLSGEVQ